MYDSEEIQHMYEILKKILKKILQVSNNEWRSEIEYRTKRLNAYGKNRYRSLIAVKPPLQEPDLEDAMNTSTNHSFETSSPLFLPPLDGESNFIPALIVKCWFENAPPILQLRIGMFGPYDKDGNKLPGIGFRIETRHPGPHDYDHVQLTSGPFDDTNLNKEHLNCPTWLPHTWPAFLIPSNNPISLIISMLVSFYGKSILQYFTDIRYQDYIKAITHIFR